MRDWDGEASAWLDDHFFDVTYMAMMFSDFYDPYPWARNVEWAPVWLRHAWEHWRVFPVRDYAFAPVYVDDESVDETWKLAEWARTSWPRAIWEGRP